MTIRKSRSSFPLCVRDNGAEDLEQRKLYLVVTDREAAREDYLRIVDESGEDYLYPSELFVPLRLPAAIARRLLSASGRTTATRSSGKLRLRTAR
jgi:hypothetical protein